MTPGICGRCVHAPVGCSLMPDYPVACCGGFEPDPVQDLARIRRAGERFRAELPKGREGRYPELAETVEGIRARAKMDRPANEDQLRGCG